MRICLVHRDLHAITRGGIGTIYRELAGRLRDAGHDVALLTQQSPQPLTLPGIRVLTLPRTENLDAHQRQVSAALTDLRPDLVECSSWEAEALHYAYGPRAQRAPVIVRTEFSAATMGATGLVEAERELMQAADAILAVSQFAARDVAKAYRVPAPPVVPNGVDRARFRPGPAPTPVTGYRITLDRHGAIATRTPLADLTEGQPPPPWSGGRPRLIWVGKITPMKGWDRLEGLVAHLRGRAHVTVLLGHSRAFCPLTLSGNGDLTILQDLDDADLVSFYRAADWLVSTSRWEGFGLAIAEALACGTPVLLPADLGTAAELLAEGGGHTYENASHVAATLQAGSPPAAHLPAGFDWDRNLAATLEAYRAAVGLVETR